MTKIWHCSSCDQRVSSEMMKVDQTKFGHGKGNCLPACIATITGIPLEEIPNFCELYSGPEWYAHFIRWLRPLGLAPWSVTMDGVPSFIGEGFADIPWIACGHTDRGLHCCVYIGGSLYHDPNPCRAGLQDVIDGTFFLSTQVRPIQAQEINHASHASGH